MTVDLSNPNSRLHLYRNGLLVLAAVVCGWGAPGQAQPAPAKPPDAPRPAATFDAAAIRRQAGQMAEFRALLADPDSTVRLMTMREAIRAGDALQRQMAIEAGLASTESSMVELALRGVMTNIQQIVIEFVDGEGKPTVDGGTANVRLTVAQFNSETGQISGGSSCGNLPKWSGQLQGTVFSFNAENQWCSGTMSWAAETGDFRGRINLNNGDSRANRSGVWKPR